MKKKVYYMKNDKNFLPTFYLGMRNNQDLYIRQQWQVAYYVLLLYASILGIFKLIFDSIKTNPPLLIISLGVSLVVLVLIACLSCYILKELDSSITEDGQRIKKIYKKFEEDLKKCELNNLLENINKKSSTKKITGVLSFTIIMGGIIVFFVLILMVISAISNNFFPICII